VKCKSGFVAISGGGHVGSNNNFPPYASPDAFVSESSLDQSGRGWRTTFTVASPQGATEFTAMVVCVHPR
ncbi:MAG: hypothetical protein JO222_04185, partial [Frankiales bacterium]|nr:hypothetical protein [Frankiales bacterium]